MTRPLLLDMTRAVGRRWRGATPSGIDRVCDAYAGHFRDRALAVIQVRGHAAVLDEVGSRALFAGLESDQRAFRALIIRLLALQPRRRLPSGASVGALYLNVGHSDFDLAAHWQWVRRRYRLRSVYLLHDLIPVTHRELTTPHKSRRHLGRVLGALDHAAAIVATTRAAAQDLSSCAASHGRPMPPLLVAPIAGGTLRRSPSSETDSVPTFVSVGTIEARKNHALLLRCWSLLLDRFGDAVPNLVLAGSDGHARDVLAAEFRRDPRLHGRVSVRRGLDDAALARLLGGARALLLPTLAEGYGLPVVESLGLGLPVIASDLPALREVGQGIPTFLDPRDPAAWAQAVADMLHHGPEWQRQRAAMPRFLAPDWSAHFALLEPWLADLPAQDTMSAAAPSAVARRADTGMVARQLRMKTSGA